MNPLPGKAKMQISSAGCDWFSAWQQCGTKSERVG
jgi:hypothetical protein